MPNPVKSMAGQAVSSNLSFGKRRPPKMTAVDKIWKNKFNVAFNMEYLVVAGGSGGGVGGGGAGGGGGGGFRTNVSGATSGRGAVAEAAFDALSGEIYTVTVGGAGSTSTFSTITSTGGGSAQGGVDAGQSGQAGVTGQMYGGGNGARYTDGAPTDYRSHGGGGGAGGAGANAGMGSGGGGSGHGGGSQSSSITGSAVSFSGGGGGGSARLGGAAATFNYGNGGGASAGRGSTCAVPNADSASANTGSGGGAAAYNCGGSVGGGGSGIVVIRFLTATAGLTPTIDAGLTYNTATTGSYTYYRFTSGTGPVSF